MQMSTFSAIRPVTRAWGLVAIVVSTLASAQSALVVSPCPDTSALAQVFEGIAADAGVELVDVASMAESLRPTASLALTDASQQLSSARSIFFSGDSARAEQIAMQVIAALEHGAPRDGTWPELRAAWLLRAQIAHAAGRAEDVKVASRRILDAEPDFVPDPNEISPALTARFEAAHRSLTAQRRVAIDTRPHTPGIVFVDGRARGPVPSSVPLLPGPHRVFVAGSGGMSFLHTIEVEAGRDPAPLMVDLGLEASVRTGPPFCLKTFDANVARTLGELLFAERVFVVRTEATGFRGAVIDVATGSISREASAPSAASLLDHLATQRPIVFPEPERKSAAPSRSFRPSPWGWAFLGLSLPGLVFGVLLTIQWAVNPSHFFDYWLPPAVFFGGYGFASGALFTGIWMLRSPSKPPVSVGLSPRGVVVYGMF